MGIPYLISTKFYDDLRKPSLTAYPILGRITRTSIPFFSEPNNKSEQLGKFNRDEILQLKESIYSAFEPKNNRRWYRIEEGFVHSAYIQRINNIKINSEKLEIPEQGILGKITVPFTQSWRINKNRQWKKVYRLYYDSIHWITGFQENPEGELMIQLTDEWLRKHYFISPKHIQGLKYTDLDPISPEVPPEDKRILVSLKTQTVTAIEGYEAVFSSKISTGMRYMDTPTGTFKINRKYPSKHMGNGAFTNNIFAYELPGVPWVSFFSDSGIAFHGTYWHDNFGNPMSRGCVNMSCEDANWLFRWSTPIYSEYKQDKSSWSINSKSGVTVEVL